jgi:2-(acetamidomethylene)succinate hydrolase
LAKPRRPPLVLLHGLGGSKEDWDEVVARLPRALVVLALDLPGSPHGPKLPTGYDPASLAAWLSKELAARKTGPAVLAGHSLGARVAGELAASRPAEVAALALVSPLGASAYSFTEKLKWKAMSRRAILNSVPESQMRSAAGHGFEVDGPGKRVFVERALAARTGTDAEAVVLAVEKSVDGVLEALPLDKRLAGTSMPLLLVSGALDPLAPPASTRAILKTRPDARSFELKGIGHYPMLEDPAKVAQILADFP